jgi:hypothetical protein
MIEFKTVKNMIENRVKRLRVEQKSIEGSPEWFECQACIVELRKLECELLNGVK